MERKGEHRLLIEIGISIDPISAGRFNVRGLANANRKDDAVVQARDNETRGGFGDGEDADENEVPRGQQYRNADAQSESYHREQSSCVSVSINARTMDNPNRYSPACTRIHGSADEQGD